jgi:hypothetical protein
VLGRGSASGAACGERSDLDGIAVSASLAVLLDRFASDLASFEDADEV